jgi:hypothetical protein
MGTMEAIEKTFLFILNFVGFVILSIVFLPAFFIVTYLQAAWSKMLGDIFKV